MSHTFTCKHCSHQSSVSDKLFAERIAGKVLSMPCKRCGVPLTLDGTVQRVNASPAQTTRVRPPLDPPSRRVLAVPGGTPGAVAPPRVISKATPPTLATIAKTNASRVAPASGGTTSSGEAVAAHAHSAKLPPVVASSTPKLPVRPGPAQRPAIDRRLLVPRPTNADVVEPSPPAGMPKRPSSASLPAVSVAVLAAAQSTPEGIESTTDSRSEEPKDDYRDVTSSMVVSSVPRLPVAPVSPVIVALSDESVSGDLAATPAAAESAPCLAPTCNAAPELLLPVTEGLPKVAIERPSDNELTPPAMTRSLGAGSESQPADTLRVSQSVPRKRIPARLALLGGGAVAIAMVLGFGSTTLLRHSPDPSKTLASDAAAADHAKLPPAVAVATPSQVPESNTAPARVATAESLPNTATIQPSVPTIPEAPPARVSNGEDIPDYVAKANVQLMTDLALRRAQRCHPEGHAVGTAQVFITFAPNGSVTNARLEGEPVASAPVGRCILDHARSIRIAKFEGAGFTYVKSLIMR